MNSTNAVDIVPMAEGVTELLLQPRRHHLRKREPRVSYVRDLRKKIAAAVVKPVHMLLSVAFADIDDGAPLAAVLQPWYAAIDLLRARAAERARVKGQPWELRFALVTCRETDAEAKLTKAQMKVAANPHDLAALLEKRTASREYRAVLDESDALIDERLATDGSLIA